MNHSISRRGFVAAASGAALAPRISRARAAGVSRTNVILIMADDLGYETLGCNGGTSYRTPNLDRLARTGVRFTNCYANPLCTPTRVSLMTGRFMHRNYTQFGHLPAGEPTFGHMMQDAGYATAVVGKWQLGAGRGQGGTHPDEAGFDEHLLKIESNRDGYADPIIYSSEHPEPRPMTGSYGPDVFADYIAGFLERNRNRPFFLYHPMFLTHFFFSPTPESPEWKTGDRRLTAPHHLRTHPLNTRFFTDMVAHMDKNIGRIVRKLDELGLRENTLLMFLGDNGTEVSIQSRMGDTKVQGGKGSLTDEGTHVPMVVNWPGQAGAGLVADDPVVPSDFLATIAEATGANPRRPPGDSKLDGVSFLPRVTVRPGKGRDWALVEYVHENRGSYLGHEGRCVRDRRWKLYGDGVSARGQRYFRAGQLYDMRTDPGEQQPIDPARDTPESAKARQRLQEVLNKHPVPPRLLGSPLSPGAAGSSAADLTPSSARPEGRDL